MILLRNYLSLLIVFCIFLYPACLSSASVYVVKDPEIEDFLRDILNPILDVAQVPRESINIYLLNDNSINAFVYNGKNIFVNTGLISSAESPDEIAGVLAHELGHITAGHLSRGDIVYSKANIFILLGLAALLATAPLLNGNGDIFDLVGFLSYSTLQTAKGALLSYSRSEESQADQIALEYIKESNFSLNGFYTFMEKLYKKENKAIYSLPSFVFQSTHPLTLNRMNAIDAYIKNNPQKITKNVLLGNKLLRVQAKILVYTSNVDNIKSAYNIKPNDSISIYKLAMTEYANHNFSSSIEYTNILLKDAPSDPYYLELAGDTYFAIENYQLALENYKKIRTAINNNIIYYKIARAYSVNKQYKEALATVSLSLQINKDNPGAWQLKSMILGRLNRYAEADLALAEQYFILNDLDKSLFFVKKALKELNNNTQEFLQANDLIIAINKAKS